MITPPFQVPDEVNHFYRVYQIADGGLKAEQFTQRLGGHIPRSLITLADPFLDLRWQMNRKTSFNRINKLRSIPLKPGEKVFMDFPNTALYNPVSYLPQILPVFILKQLNTAPIWIFYSARIFTFLVWIISIYLLIRSLIAFQWLITFLVLLPMPVFMSMGISADVMTNILAFLFIGYILKQKVSVQLFGNASFFTMALFVVLLASAKVVYIALVFLFLMIPGERFKSRVVYWIYFSGLLVLGLATSILWASAINDIYIPYDRYNLAFRNFLDLPRCAHMQEQMEYIFGHGFYFFQVCLRSIKQAFSMYYPGYIGTFGWLDTKMPIWLIHMSYLALFFVSLFGQDSKLRLNLVNRIVLIATAVSVTGLLLLSQLLSWECVGSEFIKTVQGRYFIPVFPLILLCVSASLKWPFSRVLSTDRLVIFYSLFILIIASVVIYKRYYVPPVYDVVEIKCDAEEIINNKLVTNHPDILLDNADRRSDEIARSGIHSLKLSEEHPYGFTYQLAGGGYGDIIDVEVWRLGNYGSIVIAGDGGKAFYVGTNEAKFEREGEWNKLHYQYTLESDLHGKGIAVYIFNKGEPCFFDDMRIKILRKKNFLGL